VPGDSVPNLRVGVSDLRKHPGSRRRIERGIPLGCLSVTGSAVPAEGVAAVDVTIESLSDGVTVTGEVHFPWEGPCRRCLEPTSGEGVVTVREVFKDQPEGEDLLPLEGDTVDLGAAVHDAVVLGLPMAPLCSEDCPGPAPEEFPVVTAGDESAAPTDPRWAALSELRFDAGDDDG
jgi:uncharacterized protein